MNNQCDLGVLHPKVSHYEYLDDVFHPKVSKYGQIASALEVAETD